MPNQPKQSTNQPKKRKTHSNKGAVYMTARDYNVIRWIVEQDEVSVPQLQILLARYDEKAKEKELVRRVRGVIESGRVVDKQYYDLIAKWEGKDAEAKPTLSLTHTLGIIARWKKAGWVEYRNPYRDPHKPGSVYATRKGISDFGYKFDFRVRDLESLDHLFAVNFVRLWIGLWLKDNGYAGKWKWHSERYLRQTFPNEDKYPDAEVSYGESLIAIEVETSRKSLSTYQDIKTLYDNKSVGSRRFERASEYNGVWFFAMPELEKVIADVFTGNDDWYELHLLSKLALEDGSTFNIS